MLGRLYLSGHLDRMNPRQLESVREAVRVYQDIRADLAHAVPSWPLGLPGWTDPWLALALRTRGVTYLAVWRREGASETTTLSLPHLRGEQVDIDVLYPRQLPAWTCDWAPGGGSLTVAAAQREAVSARILRLTGPAVGTCWQTSARPGPAARSRQRSSAA